MLVARTLAVAVLAWGAALTGCTSSGQNSVVPVYNMGDRAQAGPLIYTAFETQWKPQLETGILPRVPAHRFMLVRLSIGNSGSSEVTVPAISLTDDNGQKFAELMDGDGVPQWMGYVRKIKPADTLSGYVLFDAPPQHYRMEVTDEPQDKKAIIDIPMSFAAEAPMELPEMQIPVPQPPPAPKK